MATGTGVPLLGQDTTGADTYVTVLAAPTAPKAYTHVVAHCITNSAILSFDGGTTESAVVVAATAPIEWHAVYITGAIQAKNRTAGQNYANLFVYAW